jgi:hypothetical protein
MRIRIYNPGINAYFFLLGQNPGDIKLQAAIEQEFAQHKDLVQGNFIDSYYNNTWKTALGLRWAVEHCPKECAPGLPFSHENIKIILKECRARVVEDLVQ